MPSTGSRFALAAVVAFAMVASGCTGGAATPAETAAQPATTTPAPITRAPTYSGPEPLTNAEFAWLAALPKFAIKAGDTFDQNEVLTPAKLRSVASLFRSCRRQLAPGLPSSRLLPVYELVVKACREFDKAAACFATAARLDIRVEGSADDLAFRRALRCGFAGQRAGQAALGEAMKKGEKI